MQTVHMLNPCDTLLNSHNKCIFYLLGLMLYADMLRLTDLPCHSGKLCRFPQNRFLKSRIFKNPLIVLPFFLLKAISCDNLAEVAEKNQY